MKTVTMFQFRRDAGRPLDAVQRGERLLLPTVASRLPAWSPVGRETAQAPDGDPLLRVDDYAVDGPVGQLANEDVDRLIYDA